MTDKFAIGFFKRCEAVKKAKAEDARTLAIYEASREEWKIANAAFTAAEQELATFIAEAKKDAING